MTSKIPDGMADRILVNGALRNIPGLETRQIALDQPVMLVGHDLPLDLATTGAAIATATTAVTFAEVVRERFSSDAETRSRMIPFPALLVAGRIGWVSGTVAPTATWAAVVKVGTIGNATKFLSKAIVATDFVGEGNVINISATMFHDALIDKDEVVIFKTSADGTTAKKVSVALVVIPRDPGATS